MIYEECHISIQASKTPSLRDQMLRSQSNLEPTVLPQMISTWDPSQTSCQASKLAVAGVQPVAVAGAVPLELFLRAVPGAMPGAVLRAGARLGAVPGLCIGLRLELRVGLGLDLKLGRFGRARAKLGRCGLPAQIVRPAIYIHVCACMYFCVVAC
jgi:hypothetical protein